MHPEGVQDPLLDGLDKALLSLARWARGHGDNHRDYLVGTAVSAQVLRGGDIRFFTGYNIMRFGDACKRCAELMALSIALDSGCNYIGRIAVVGEPQPDDHTGICPPTLLPCHICQYCMVHQYRLSPDTRIITALPQEDGLVRVHTLEQILEIERTRVKVAQEA